MERILLQLWTILWSWSKHQAPFWRVVIFGFRMLSCRLEMKSEDKGFWLKRSNSKEKVG